MCGGALRRLVGEDIPSILLRTTLCVWWFLAMLCLLIRFPVALPDVSELKIKLAQIVVLISF